MFLGHDERRQKPHDIVARNDGQHAAPPQFLNHDAWITGTTQAEEQSFAAHLGDLVAMLGFQFFQTITEGRTIFLDGIKKPRGCHFFQYREADGGREGVAPEGRTMSAGHHALSGPLRGEAGADRQTATERLGDRHDVRGDAPMFMREQPTGPPDTGLDFIKNKKETLTISNLAQRRQEFIRRHTDAALALDGLNHDGRRRRRNGALECRDIAERYLIEAVDLWTKAVEVLRLITGRQRGEGATMKRRIKCNDPIAVQMTGHGLEFAGNLDGALDRLSARIAKKDRIRERARDQQVGEFFLGRDVDEVGGVPDTL